MATRDLMANDPALKSMLSIVGSHFVDIYFNHVYSSARSNVQKDHSLTSEYTRQVQAYIIGVKTDQGVYKSVAENLHRYHLGVAKFGSDSFAGFVDTLTDHFIPEQYRRHMSPKKKDEFLSTVICDLVSGLGAHFTTPDALRRVIDYHDQYAGDTIQRAQQEALTILMRSRGDIYNKFLRTVGQAKDGVSAETLNQLRAVIKKLAYDKAHLKAEVRELEDQVNDCGDELAKARKREGQYRKIINHLQIERTQGPRAAALANLAPVSRGDLAEEKPRAAPRAHRPLSPPKTYIGRNTIAELPSDRGAERISADFFTSPPLDTQPPRQQTAGRPGKAKGGAPRGGVQSVRTARTGAGAPAPSARAVDETRPATGGLNSFVVEISGEEGAGSDGGDDDEEFNRLLD